MSTVDSKSPTGSRTQSSNHSALARRTLSPVRHGWAGWVAVALLILITGSLQLRLIRLHGLWTDEIFSLAVATGHSVEHPPLLADSSRGDFRLPESPVPVQRIQDYARHESRPADPARVVRAVYLSDTSPPLYYLLLHFWTRWIGVSDSDVRALSVGFALACIPLFYLLARRFFSAGNALASTLLLCAAPAFVYYAGEARMYSLLWFCVLSAAWAASGMMKAEARWPVWTVWILGSAAGFYTHYFFVFPWFVFAAISWWTAGPKRGRLVLSVLVILVLILPWYIFLPGSLGNWRVTQDWLKVPPYEFSLGREMWESLRQYFTAEGRQVWWPHPRAEWTAGLVVAACGVAAWFRRSMVARGGAGMIWLWFLAALAGPVIFDLVLGTYSTAVMRYSITAMPAACLLLGWALQRIARPLFSLVATLALAGAWSPQVYDFFQDVDRNDQNYWAIGAFFETEATEKDVVLIHSIPTGAIGIARYCQTRAPIAIWVEQTGVQQVPQSLVPLIAGRERVFFVDIHSVGAPAPEAAWLQANATFVRELRVSSARVVEYKPASGPRF